MIFSMRDFVIKPQKSLKFTLKIQISPQLKVTHTDQIHIIKENLYINIIEKNRVRLPLS
jgi:hypothetical protein